MKELEVVKIIKHSNQWVVETACNNKIAIFPIITKAKMTIIIEILYNCQVGWLIIIVITETQMKIFMRI